MNLFQISSSIVFCCCPAISRRVALAVRPLEASVLIVVIIHVPRPVVFQDVFQQSTLEASQPLPATDFHVPPIPTLCPHMEGKFLNCQHDCCSLLNQKKLLSYTTTNVLQTILVSLYAKPEYSYKMFTPIPIHMEHGQTETVAHCSLQGTPLTSPLGVTAPPICNSH